MFHNQPYYVKSGKLTSKRSSIMIYYLFPKPNNELVKQLFFTISNYTPVAEYSPSVCMYMNELASTIQNTSINIENTKYLKTLSQMEGLCSIETFELIEMFQTLPIKASQSSINVLHFSIYTLPPFKWLRKNNVDQHVIFNATITETIHLNNKYNIISCSSFSENEYENAINAIFQMCISVENQEQKGVCVLKYNDTFLKISLEMIMFFSLFYEKTFIFKPSISDVSTGCKYIVFNGFLPMTKSKRDLNLSLYLQMFSSRKNGQFVHGILKEDIPLFFISKLEEINSIYVQPRFEHLKQMMDYSENKDYHIKCQEWFNKYMAK